MKEGGKLIECIKCVMYKIITIITVTSWPEMNADIFKMLHDNFYERTAGEWEQKGKG
jgi:hypothetical protein